MHILPSINARRLQHQLSPQHRGQLQPQCRHRPEMYTSVHTGTQVLAVPWVMTISGIGVGKQHSLAKTLCPPTVAPAVSPNLNTKRELAHVAAVSTSMAAIMHILPNINARRCALTDTRQSRATFRGGATASHGSSRALRVPKNAPLTRTNARTGGEQRTSLGFAMDASLMSAAQLQAGITARSSPPPKSLARRIRISPSATVPPNYRRE